MTEANSSQPPGAMPRIWNLLHDAHIEGVAVAEDELRLRVSIEYLTDLLPQKSDGLELVLRECTEVRYERHEDDWKSFPLSEVPGNGILSSDSAVSPFVIWLNDGKLTIACEDAVSIFNCAGEPVPIAQLEAVAKQYWDAFNDGD